MMRYLRVLFLTLPFLFHPMSLTAQENEKLAAAKRLFGNPSYSASMSRGYSTEFVLKRIKKRFPNWSEEQYERLHEAFEKELQKLREEVEADYIRLLSEVYSLEELRAYDDFMRSPIGSAIMLKQNDYQLAADPIQRKHSQRFNKILFRALAGIRSD